MLVLVIVAATIKNPSFLFSSNSWRDLLLTPSILLLLAIGQAVVIITRNVDLSVGSVLGLTAYMTGQLFIDQPGIPIVAVFARRAGGRWPARARQRPDRRHSRGVPALVITLGTLYIYRGIVLTWAGSDRINASDMPKEFLALGTKSILVDPGAHPDRPGRARASWATTSTRSGAGASSTRSAPTRTPPCSTDSRCAAG